MQPKERGVLTEAIVLSRLLEFGVDVSQPFGDNSRYDFIADVDGELSRVQVKTAREEHSGNGTIVFNTQSVKSNISQNRTEDYNGDIDAFVAYYPDTDTCYWVDIDEAAKSEMCLRVNEAGNNHPSINWAEDYELGNVLDRNI